MKNKKIRIGILLIIILICVYGFSKIFSKKDKFPLYTVKCGPFLIDVQASGLVESGRSIIISAPSNLRRGSFTIVDMVEEGTYVKEGDFLLQFDTSELMENVETYENQLESAKASYESQLANNKQTMANLESSLKIEEYSLQQARISASNSKYEAENTQKEAELTLKKAEISYQQSVDEIEKTKEINKASLRQAEIQVKQAEISLRKVKEDLANLTIKSPGEGLVVYKKTWEGDGLEKLKVGSSVWRGLPLMEIPEGGNMNVALNVNEVDISNIQKGQKVLVNIDALPGNKYTGEITSIASLAHEDDKTGKKVFEVEVKINEISDDIKPGMSSDCQIIVAQMDNVISVPIDAVSQNGGQTGIYNASGKFIPVKTGKVSSDLIVIKRGLEEGDKIRLTKTSGSGENLHEEMDMQQRSMRGSGPKPGGRPGGRPRMK